VVTQVVSSAELDLDGRPVVDMGWFTASGATENRAMKPGDQLARRVDPERSWASSGWRLIGCHARTIDVITGDRRAEGDASGHDAEQRLPAVREEGC
jgi:hypothetical protein